MRWKWSFFIFLLLQIFDGWVLKGEKFPSSHDHPLAPHERYTDYCSSMAPGLSSRSSQNVAMIFFRIHSPDSGFTLAVKKMHNPMRESHNTFWWPEEVKSFFCISVRLFFLFFYYWLSLLLSCRPSCLFLFWHVCLSWSFVLRRALIKARSDMKRLTERDAPVFQLLGKHGVTTVSSNITITAWI